MRIKFLKLNLLMAGALIAAPGMVAQTTDETEARQQTVIVTGSPIRDSQQAAIDAKRNADNVVDIIAADTIGRFPDQNLADSLGRLPGIAIERDQGQARFINFRGAPFRYTAIAFDGVQVPGAENGRTPRFDSFPSVITSSVEANKAITPDMPGEAVAGFVNIRTFNPFDREGLGVSLEAGYGKQELGGGPVSKLNGRISWSNDQLGLVAFASKNRREQVTDNREYDLSFNANGDYLVSQLDFRSYFVNREDNAWGGKIELRPSEGPISRLFATTLYTDFIDEEERTQFVFQFGAGAAARRGTLTPGETGYEPLVIVRRLLQDGEYDNSTFTNTLGAELELGEWALDARLNYTETENNTFLPIPFSVGTAAGSYDITDLNDPLVNVFARFTQTPIRLDQINFTTNLGILVDARLDNQAWKAKLDAERPMTLMGRDLDVKIGAQYDTREAEGNSFALIAGGFPSAVQIGAFGTSIPWYTDFTNSINASYFDNPGLRDAWSQAVGGFDLTIPGDLAIVIEEDIYAAYAMAKLAFEGGNAVFGARVEHTEYTTDGPSLDISYSDDYTAFLPSLHVNFDLRDDLKLRTSLTTGLSRPNYSELRASASINPTTTPPSVSGGNPTLDAERTWGGDVSLEWYFAPASLLAVGAFHREISDVIYSDSTSIDGGIYDPSAAGETWTLNGFVNGRNGRLSGIEANFIGLAEDLLPSPFDGLGVSANVTLIDSEFETNSGVKFSLPGTSDLIYNASLFYEKGGLSARLNYQFRDAWLSTTENDSLAEFWDSQERVDASLRYTLPFELRGSQITLFANGNNLSDAVDVRYDGVPQLPNQVERYGRYWLLGLRADF